MDTKQFCKLFFKENQRKKAYKHVVSLQHLDKHTYTQTLQPHPLPTPNPLPKNNENNKANIYFFAVEN